MRHGFWPTSRIFDPTGYTIAVAAVIDRAVALIAITGTRLQPEFKVRAGEPEVIETERAASEDP
jgi:hypothetical protein